MIPWLYILKKKEKYIQLSIKPEIDSNNIIKINIYI